MMPLFRITITEDEALTAALGRPGMGFKVEMLMSTTVNPRLVKNEVKILAREASTAWDAVHDPYWEGMQQ